MEGPNRRDVLKKLLGGVAAAAALGKSAEAALHTKVPNDEAALGATVRDEAKFSDTYQEPDAETDDYSDPTTDGYKDETTPYDEKTEEKPSDTPTS